MAHIGELERWKSTKSAKSAASNESVLRRWKSFVKPFAAQDPSDRSGRGSCDNGFEGHWEGGVPSVRPRTASKTGQEGWPRALSNAPSNTSRVRHMRYPSSQAMSATDGFRMTYDTDVRGSDDSDLVSARPSASRGSQTQSFQTAPGAEHDAGDIEDDDMGLAQQRRSKRYSGHKSPLSPTFNFGFKDRKTDDRAARSTLKRESIRLSALPPMPRSEGSRRSFPAGQGLASMISISSPKKSPELHNSFIFPRPPRSDFGMRSPTKLKDVTWTGLLDPERPQNRPVPVKLISTVLLLGLTLTVTFVSSAMTPASFRIAQDFDTASEVIILASALTVLGFAFGTPIFGALSEQYGRKRPILLGLAVFALFNIPVGLTENLPTLLAFRFFAGVFGAAPLAIVPPALADFWSPVGRGIALSFFAAVSVIGPIGGAVAGSYLAVVNYPGWRWTAWIGTFLSVFFGLAFALAYTESSEAILLQRRAKKLRLVTKDWTFHAEGEEAVAGLRENMIKTALLVVEPSLLLPTVHMSFACGVLNLMFVSYGLAFHNGRHWLGGGQDLPLAPMMGGCLIGIFINFMISKKKYTALFRRDGFAPPEARLIPWIIGTWILPVGLLVFAWTSTPEITFIPQIMAGVPTGIGISLILIGGFNYIMDTYITMPSLAIGANTFVRSAIAFAFPLFAPPMYRGLGVAWANTALAIVAVALVPIPILLMKLGLRFRESAKFAGKGRGMSNASRPDLGSEMAQKDDALSVTMEGLSTKREHSHV